MFKRIDHVEIVTEQFDRTERRVALARLLPALSALPIEPAAKLARTAPGRKQPACG
jgi:hypothetical protein